MTESFGRSVAYGALGAAMGSVISGALALLLGLSWHHIALGFAAGVVTALVMAVVRHRNAACRCEHGAKEHLPWGGCVGGPLDDATCSCRARQEAAR